MSENQRKYRITVSQTKKKKGEFHVNDFLYVLLQHCMNVEV